MARGSLGSSPILAIATGLTAARVQEQERARTVAEEAERLMAPRREARRLQDLARTELSTFDATLADDAFDETRDYQKDLTERRQLRQRANAYRTVNPSASMEEAEALMMMPVNARPPKPQTPWAREGFKTQEELIAHQRAVAGARTPETVTPPWIRAGFATEAEYLAYQRREASARRAPEAPAAPPRVGTPTEGERKAAAFYTSGSLGYETLERLINGDDPTTPEVEIERGREVPGFWAQTSQKVGFGAGNMMTNTQVRQMRQASLMLADAWLRYTSGAAVPESEVERFAESFIPRAGDDPGTLEQKRLARARIMQALRAGAGRALDPNAQATQPSLIERYQLEPPE